MAHFEPPQSVSWHGNGKYDRKCVLWVDSYPKLWIYSGLPLVHSAVCAFRTLRSFPQFCAHMYVKINIKNTYNEKTMCHCVYACLHGCMYVCMDASVYGCMDGWMDGSMYACMHVCRYACMHVLVCVDKTMPHPKKNDETQKRCRTKGNISFERNGQFTNYRKNSEEKQCQNLPV